MVMLSVTVPSALSMNRAASQVSSNGDANALPCSLPHVAPYFVTHFPSLIGSTGSTFPCVAKYFAASFWMHCAYLPAAFARPAWQLSSGETRAMAVAQGTTATATHAITERGSDRCRLSHLSRLISFTDLSRGLRFRRLRHA